MNKMSIVKKALDDMINMVVWKHEYDRLVKSNLIMGRLHIKKPKTVPIEVCAPTEDIMMELYSPKRERMDSMDTCGPTPKRRRIDTDEMEWQMNYPGSPRIWNLSPAPTPSPRQVECWGCEWDEPNQMAHECMGYD